MPYLASFPARGRYEARVRYNGATFKASPNFTNGRNGHMVKAVCLHITQGKPGEEYPNAITWFLNPASDVSAHFVVAPTGDITQCVDTANTAWANGLSYYARLGDFPKDWAMWQGAGWYCPHKHLVKPKWKLIEQGVNPNHQTISIEMAGQSGAAIPAAQWGALYSLLRWLGEEYPQLLPYRPGTTLIGHYMLDPIDRGACPGPAFDLKAIAASVFPEHGDYYISGVPVYNDSQCREFSGRRLRFGTKVHIDKIASEQPHDYAPSAGHISDADGGGFIDLNGAVKP